MQSPMVPNGDYGDVYISTVKQGTVRVDNPLHRSLCVKDVSIQTLSGIGLSKYPVTELVLRDERLWQYLKLSIPPKDFNKVKRILEEYEVAIVCIDSPDFLERCIDDVRSSGEENNT